MTDPRIAIVREWASGVPIDLREDMAARLLAKLDAHAASMQTDDLVERVSQAIYESKWPGRVYEALADEKKDDFRRYARAALEAMPAGMSEADRAIIEAADAWHDSGGTRELALADAVESKRALVRGSGK